MEDNPYYSRIIATLPRLLSMFDRDMTSSSYGMGDRYRWAWGLIDFGNGKFQGAAHGMARLWAAGLWPYRTNLEVFLKRIDSIFLGTASVTRENGSLEEAFPNEGSFALTGFIAFDLLCAYTLLKENLSEEMGGRWLSIVRPLIGFLHEADETHGVISNHLAGVVAALVRWHAITGELISEVRAIELLERIKQNQSNEGWFREYEGADPGYQSFCTYYLADIHQLRPDWKLDGMLDKSIHFLWHFANPDGSFGGLYGSRCTRFYCPAGIEALASQIPEASVLAEFMRASIHDRRVVSLDCMDDANLVPMFNAYCWAATLWQINQTIIPGAPCLLPAARRKKNRVHFPEAGLVIDAGPRHYTVISIHKGGVVVHFVDCHEVVNDGGVVVRNKNGQFGSSQSFSIDNRFSLTEDDLIVEAVISPMPKQLPSPFQFVILRLLSLSVFRVRRLRELTKVLLVKLLITQKRVWPARNRRRISLGVNLSLRDELDIMQEGYTHIESPGPFVAIHMASQGYWQMQDE